MSDASIHEGHRARLRQQFLTSPDSLSDVQLLELLLSYAIPRRDTNPLAHALLQKFGSLRLVANAPLAALVQTPGMTERAAVLISASQQLSRRLLAAQCDYSGILRDAEAIGNFLLPRFFDARDELVYLLCFDAKYKLLDSRELFHGSVNTAAVSIRKVVETALACNATAVVLAHNHTSGIALPSREDLATTERVARALQLVDVLLADHIIVADGDYVSLAQDGYFAQLDLSDGRPD